MEPFTHFLTGACLSRAGLNRKTALATVTLTLAAESPDLDVIGRFGGPAFGFAHHRGFTHSFLGLIPLSALVVGFVYLIWRLRGSPVKDPNLPPRWGLLFGYAYLAGISHILLDFTNNYGVRPFWPFVEKWYSWDIVFIFEPVMFLLLLLGLILPGLFSLVDGEVGARSRGPRGQLSAIVALACVVLMYGVRDYEHRRAINALQARTYEGANPLRVSAYPAPINPFQWSGVVETPAFFVLAPVDSLTPDVDPEGRLVVRYKPEETPVTLAAKRSFLGRTYLDWAQYPITETETLSEGGYVVQFQDLRFDQLPGFAGRLLNRRGKQSKPLGAGVMLDGNLRVVGDVYGAGKDRVALPEPGHAGN